MTPDAAEQADHAAANEAIGIIEKHRDEPTRGKPDDVDVFLLGGGGDHLGGLAQAGVDHFHPGVAQGARDDLGAAIVAVQARLGNQHPDLLLSHARGRILQNSATTVAKRARGLGSLQVF